MPKILSSITVNWGERGGDGKTAPYAGIVTTGFLIQCQSLIRKSGQESKLSLIYLAILRASRPGSQEAREAQLLRNRNGAIRSFQLCLRILEGGDGFRHIHLLQVTKLKRQGCAHSFVH